MIKFFVYYVHLSVLCFNLFVNLGTAQDVHVCVSYGGPQSTDPFINVDWTVSRSC